MTRETDLPRLECGRELARSTVTVSDLSVPVSATDEVTVAVRPEFRIRCVPEAAVSQPFSDPTSVPDAPERRHERGGRS